MVVGRASGVFLEQRSGKRQLVEFNLLVPGK